MGLEQERKELGAREVVRFLKESGFRHIFGLPGSSLVSLLQELADSPVRIIPTIHESVTIAAADGYARVTGAGAAFIYMVPGTANALANLYNAWRDESPLLVLCSQQAAWTRTREGTIGEGDLVPLVAPFCRHARELAPGMPVYHHLAAASRAARGAPTGPAFVSLPEDVLEAEAPVVPVPRTTRVSSGAPDISELAQRLARARRPLIVAGGQVRRHGGADALAALAERHHIAVAAEPGFNDRLALSPGHPNFLGGMTGLYGSVAEARADFVLVIGGRFIAEGHPRPDPYFPEAGFVAHVNADPAKLEETRVANWSCACDPSALLAALLRAAPDPDEEMIRQRRAFIDEAKAATLPPGNPFAETLASYGIALGALHDALEHGWVVDEAVMGSVALVGSLRSGDGGRYMGATGGSLGWGTGAAVGAALGSGEPVTCVLGDGALRFGLHGLWTAVAEKLPITFVVLDNGGYGSTRYFSRAYAERAKPAGGRNAPSYAGMDFREAGGSLADLIRGFGLPCTGPVAPQDAREALEVAWRSAKEGPNAIIISLPFGD